MIISGKEEGYVSVILNLLIEVFPSTKYFTDVDHNKELTFGPLFQKNFSNLIAFIFNVVWNGVLRRVVESSFKVHLCVANGEIINAR